MTVRGLTFVGTRTRAAADTVRFAERVLGLAPRTEDGATYFDLPDGSTFAVQPVDDHEPEERTVGLLVDDLDATVTRLRGAGLETDEVSETERHRFVHLRGPDGRLYELVEERPSTRG